MKANTTLLRRFVSLVKFLPIIALIIGLDGCATINIPPNPASAPIPSPAPPISSPVVPSAPVSTLPVAPAPPISSPVVPSVPVSTLPVTSTTPISSPVMRLSTNGSNLGTQLDIKGANVKSNAITPTKYDDVINFLEKDDTYKILYKPGHFVCWKFAKRLQDHAVKSDISCAVVTLAWGTGHRSHVIDAFKTDEGLIWVDATGSHLKKIMGHFQIQKPMVKGDNYVYEETGGLPPEKVTLNAVTYSWQVGDSPPASLRNP